MSTKKMQQLMPRGLTLIELLAVMVIILILAGLFVGVGGPARESARKRKAEVMISALEVAIAMYRADTGVYPVTDAGIGCANLYDRLTNTAVYGPTGTAPMPGWAGPYMAFKNEDRGTIGADTHIKDPWATTPLTIAHVYNYQTPGTNNTISFDLWSNGPDGVSGNADDITNW
jgi:general secretion pathway protein G